MDIFVGYFCVKTMVGLSQQLSRIAAICILLPACTQFDALQSPDNPGGKFYGTQNEVGDFVRHQRSIADEKAGEKNCIPFGDSYSTENYRIDKIITESTVVAHSTHGANSIFHGSIPLSPGDLVGLSMQNGEGFAGSYVIDSNGYLMLPYVKPILAMGLSTSILAEKVELALVRAEMFRPATALVDLRLLQWSDIEVLVSGAVFEPGRVQINQKIPEQLLRQRIEAFGDYSSDRMLSEALRAASGVRPDAKLDQVILIRNGWHIQVDMSGVFTGRPVRDIALAAGDRVIVPSTGCFQQHLVRPTQITPKGLRVFMSNLIDSAKNNAAAAVGRYSSSMPYGTRLLQAAVSANCIGGKQWTNAPRKVLIASKNPLTGKVQVVERSVEQLMRQAHITEINPYLMPNDAIACYDSSVTNIRDIARSLSEIISPFKLM